MSVLLICYTAHVRGLRFVFLAFFVWRVLLFLPLVASELILPYRQGYEYTNLWKFTKPYEPVSNPLLFPWANFDGVHYLSIAKEGYRDNERFFPLYPLLIRIFSFGLGVPFGAPYFFAGLAISNLSFLVASIVFYKLIRLDYSDSSAKASIISLLVLPTSFFFASIYSESLFLLLTFLSFYFARRKRWILSGIFAMLLSATRIVGIAILPALAYEFWKDKKDKIDKKDWKKILAIGISPLGMVAYSLYNHFQFGNAMQFLMNQQEIANNRSMFVFPLQTLFRYVKILSTVPYSQYEWWISELELATFFFVALLLYIGWKKDVRRSYLVFAALSFLAPISSGTFNGLPRYTAVLFPIFIAVALAKSTLVKVTYVAVSVVLLFLLLAAFSRGYFVA